MRKDANATSARVALTTSVGASSLLDDDSDDQLSIAIKKLPRNTERLARRTSKGSAPAVDPRQTRVGPQQLATR